MGLSIFNIINKGFALVKAAPLAFPLLCRMVASSQLASSTLMSDRRHPPIAPQHSLQSHRRQRQPQASELLRRKGKRGGGGGGKDRMSR